MLKKLSNFVLYHNGFPLLLMFLVLGAGSAMAANEDVRESIVSSQDKVISVDNSYIRNIDLKKFKPRAEVLLVEEDSINYYVTYELETIEIVDGSWKKVIKEDIITVNKEQLDGRDLGLYVEEELNELVANTIAYLKEVQEIEKRSGQSDKVVERRYRGLVGRYLDSSQRVFAGYDPVVEPPVKVAKVPRPKPKEEPVVVNDLIELDSATTSRSSSTDESGGSGNSAGTTQTASSSDETVEKATTTPPAETATSTDNATGTTTNQGTNEGDEPATTTPPADETPPVLTLNGEATLTLIKGSAYQELGATAIDDVDGDVSSSIVIEGPIDINTPGSYTRTYTIVDAAGNEASITREVVVEAAPEVSGTPNKASSTTE